jgi:hypothetical protein
MKLLYNPATFDYFKHPERTGETNEFFEVTNNAFYSIYFNNKLPEDKKSKMKSYNTPQEHPFIYKLMEYLEAPKIVDENSHTDDIFSYYIYKVSKYARAEAFQRVLKFIILYREYVNFMYKDRVKNKQYEGQTFDYTEITNPEDIPDISNEFIIDFLDAENELFEYSREEAIDLTQNFCQWLYDNNFTCSKLTLLNNY